MPPYRKMVFMPATNHDLTHAVSEGAFRQDLFFRLHVFPVHVPTLRERIEDLPALVQHLATRIRPRRPPRFTQDALELMMTYAWPGNVRELANIIERLTILGGPDIDATRVQQVLPLTSVVADGGDSVPTPLLSRSLTDALDDYERSLIVGAITKATGNVAEAARILQTDRGNLYRRLKRLGITASSVAHSD